MYVLDRGVMELSRNPPQDLVLCVEFAKDVVYVLSAKVPVIQSGRLSDGVTFVMERKYVRYVMEMDIFGMVMTDTIQRTILLILTINNKECPIKIIQMYQIVQKILI